VLAATGPFAPTGYSRARLLRQMYASGLLADGVGGAPNSLVRGDPVDCRVSVDFRGSQR
jgi:hypothetical protein